MALSLRTSDARTHPKERGKGIEKNISGTNLSISRRFSGEPWAFANNLPFSWLMSGPLFIEKHLKRFILDKKSRSIWVPVSALQHRLLRSWKAHEIQRKVQAIYQNSNLYEAFPVHPQRRDRSKMMRIFFCFNAEKDCEHRIAFFSQAREISLERFEWFFAVLLASIPKKRKWMCNFVLFSLL